MKKGLILKSSILAVAAGLSVTTAHDVFADELTVQIMGINDFHGALDTTGTARLEGETVRNAGTAALLDTYMDDSEKEFKEEATTANLPSESIRVQAGDLVGASPANSGLLQDEPTVSVSNEIGFDYGTLGNHEFDEGLEEFNRIMTGQTPEPGKFNPIVDSYDRKASQQEIVIANVIDKTTGEIPYGWKPYAVKSIPVNDKTANIGFIGVVTTEIPNLVLKQNYEQYDFLDEAETLAKYSKELTDQGIKAIVVLAHVPATSKDGVAGGEVADILTKLKTLNPNHSIDLVFAGHNHVHTNGLADNTLVVQSTSQGKAYADVRGVYDTDLRDFKTTPTAKIIAVAPDKKEPNQTIKAIVDEANTIVKQVTERKIATAKEAKDITREVNGSKESPVGHLITSAQLAIAKKSGYDVDFAMTNNGGIRADLKVNPDKSITWGAAQAVQPFGNILQVVTLTGQQIYDVLNQQYDENEKYFLQISGLRYEYIATPTDEGTTFKVDKVYHTANGSTIDKNATYTLVINDFLYGGGDGFSVFKDAKLIGAINPDTEVFIEYLTDLEKSGQFIDISTTINKQLVPASSTAIPSEGIAFPTVEALPEGNLPSKPSVPTFHTTTTKYDASKTASLTVTPSAKDNRSTAKTNTTPSLKQNTNSEKVTVTYNTLPKTNEDESLSIILTLLGGMAVGFTSLLKRQENK